jgi:hypothetical protein
MGILSMPGWKASARTQFVLNRIMCERALTQHITACRHERGTKSNFRDLQANVEKHLAAAPTTRNAQASSQIIRDRKSTTCKLANTSAHFENTRPAQDADCTSHLGFECIELLAHARVVLHSILPHSFLPGPLRIHSLQGVWRHLQ